MGRTLKFLLSALLIAVVAIACIPIFQGHASPPGYELAQAPAETPPVLPAWAVALTMVAQFMWPFALKSKIGPGLKKSIPLVNLALAIGANLLGSLAAAAAATSGIKPAAYTLAATGIVYAGFFGTFKNVFLQALLDALGQTLIVTGIHSGTKNAIARR